MNLGVLLSWTFLWIFCITIPMTSGEMKLILVQTVWRHGIRAPEVIYPNSKYQKDFYYPGPGELTSQGMQEHVNLSRKLKNRYAVQNKLISKRYRSSEVYIRSWDSNKTITSAISHFAAFYFGEGIPAVDYPYDYIWPGLFTPVPVHVVPKEKDYLLDGDACTYGFKLTELAYQTDEYLAFLNESQTLFSYLNKYSGKTCLTRAECLQVCDTIVTEIDLRLLVEKWATDIYPVCTQFMSDHFSFSMGFGVSPVNGYNLRTEIPKVKGGPLLWEIISRMQRKYENFIDSKRNDYLTDLKYYVYSGQDISLGALFTVLDFEHTDFDKDVTPGTSNAITFELWINDNLEPVVKVLYWRRDELTYIDLSTKIHGCKYTSAGCSLSNFATRAEKYRPPEDMDVATVENPGNTDLELFPNLPNIDDTNYRGTLEALVKYFTEQAEFYASMLRQLNGE
ncbi:hypothetical protein FO519_007514 [Halicephalobus sp. NKZ332]|nr:hypothetical protein FO519_007514 [Halicephalobus sp. NKZ332]